MCIKKLARSIQTHQYFTQFICLIALAAGGEHIQRNFRLAALDFQIRHDSVENISHLGALDVPHPQDAVILNPVISTTDTSHSRNLNNPVNDLTVTVDNLEGRIDIPMRLAMSNSVDLATNTTLPIEESGQVGDVSVDHTQNYKGTLPLSIPLMLFGCCIIAFDSRVGTERLDKDILLRCQETNPDGMGIMYALKGELHQFTTMDDFDKIWDHYTSARDQEAQVAMHFRVSTKGQLSIENCHPFKIRKGFSFMHNGTMTWMTTLLDNGDSDTRNLQRLFQDLPTNFLKSALWRKAIIELVDWDRLLFMDGGGHYQMFNEFKGFWWLRDDKKREDGGVWFSHSRTKEYITTGSKPTKVVHMGFDRDRSHRPLPELQPNGHTIFCICIYCKDYKADELREKLKGKQSKRQTKRIAKKAAKAQAKEEANIEATYDMIAKEHSFDASVQRYLQRGFPVRTMDSNVLFGYGMFRDDMGGIGLPAELKQVGTGIMQRAQLWAVKSGQDGYEEAGAVLCSDRSELGIHGCLYDIGDHEAALELFGSLDEGEGCIYGDPKGSMYHRFLLPVKRANGKGVIHAWSYIANISPGWYELVAPVPMGDWSEWVTRSEHQDGEVDLDINTRGILDNLSMDGEYECPRCQGFYTAVVVAVDEDPCVRQNSMLWCFDCSAQSSIHLGQVH